MATTTAVQPGAPPAPAKSAVQSNPAVQPDTDTNAQPRARAREVTERARALSSTAGAVTLTQLRRYTGGGWLDATPATVAQVLAYTRAGGWVPGERAQWLEAFGRVYGFAVAFPVTAVAFIALWFVQRPTRVAFGVALWVAVRWAL